MSIWENYYVPCIYKIWFDKIIVIKNSKVKLLALNIICYVGIPSYVGILKVNTVFEMDIKLCNTKWCFRSKYFTKIIKMYLKCKKIYNETSIN